MLSALEQLQQDYSGKGWTRGAPSGNGENKSGLCNGRTVQAGG
ncbi:hypothetical protein [Klebsiella pneumoniae]